MGQIIYSMQFKGSAAPGSEPGTMKVTTSATSCSIKTVVGPDGVKGSFAPAEGGLAYFESQVQTIGPDAFTESGMITFGDGDHSLRFSTVNQGRLTLSADPKITSGAVIWKVEGGEGQFEDATGFITSNFHFNEAGEVADFQFGAIFVK